MKRSVGTVSRGLRAPIFNAGDKLVDIIPDLLLEASRNEGFELRDRDVLCITESIVARTQGNYASVDDIARDVQKKIPEHARSLGLLYPILSRNRFSILLKGIAMACEEIVIQLSYPSDEVGNALFDPKLLYDVKVNPWRDVLDEEQFHKYFGHPVHPFTGVDYVAFYKGLVEECGAKCRIIFSNDPKALLNEVQDVLCCDIHTRQASSQALKDAGARTVLTLCDILSDKSDKHGYNEFYGLLGSNKADEKRVKLFPRDTQPIVDEIARRIHKKSGKNIEVMIYGDGAFKDPVGKIWELADPVVSPAYTQGLSGTPNEIKIKYLADSEFSGLSEEQQREAIEERIRSKENNLVGKMASEGTTPRHLTDLLGSLADLTSGSGDKGTPLVYIQGYFDNYAD